MRGWWRGEELVRWEVRRCSQRLLSEETKCWVITVADREETKCWVRTVADREETKCWVRTVADREETKYWVKRQRIG